MSSPPPDLPIHSAHVRRQFDRRQPWAEAAFLHTEIAARMLERLRYIRLTPETVVDAGCGAGDAYTGLRERYPAAAYVGIDQSQRALAEAQRRLSPDPNKRRPLAAWLKPWRSPAAVTWHMADLARTPMTDESCDLIWSNLSLHWHPRPQTVFQEWFRVLRAQGLVMFSTYGPATLQELRAAVDRAGLETATLPLVDMHDYGDLLLEQGFVDPVMDQETLTLTYPDPAALLRDVRALGGNPNPRRRRGLCGQQFLQRLSTALDDQRQPDGRLRLTVEIAYGHAWRGAFSRQGDETRIPLGAIGGRSRKPAV